MATFNFSVYQKPPGPPLKSTPANSQPLHVRPHATVMHLVEKHRHSEPVCDPARETKERERMLIRQRHTKAGSERVIEVVLYEYD